MTKNELLEAVKKAYLNDVQVAGDEITEDEINAIKTFNELFFHLRLNYWDIASVLHLLIEAATGEIEEISRDLTNGWST